MGAMYGLQRGWSLGFKVDSTKAMSPSSLVLVALQDAIRAAGINLGTAKVIKLPSGEPAYHIDATSSSTCERWTVHAPTEYAATVELAAQLGFDLME